MNNQHLNNNSKSRLYSHDPEISAQEFLQRTAKHEVLNVLDVREPIEYHTHNVGGQNLPVGQLEGNLLRLSWNKTDDIIVVCQAGIRSLTACEILERNGFENVRNLTGGLMALRRIQAQSSSS